MYVDTDAVRWFPQVADGMTVPEVSELEMVTQSGVSRALAERQANPLGFLLGAARHFLGRR
jgi:hypothetical protein